jgi:hypothetical protein
MNAHHLTELAKAAKRDGLTLTWCLIYLAENLERDRHLKGHSTEAADFSQATASTGISARLEEEALALVLFAAIRAYPAGADIAVESIP